MCYIALHSHMNALLKKAFGDPHLRFFFPGVRAALKLSSLFHRELALEQAMEYTLHCKLGGDYLEFGVWQGRTFAAACRLAQERSLKMRFWAFDSFEGLPSDEGMFHKGEFSSSQARFLRNLKKTGADLARVEVVPGWFDKLGPLPSLKARIIWIDCDLYESTVPVLKLITPTLQSGTVIFFDDWNCFAGDPDQGEQRACAEWLRENPEITLRSFLPFGWHGQSFIVRKSD